MPFSIDPEIGAALVALFPEAAEPIPVGDVATRREGVEGLQREMFARIGMPDDVETTDYETTAPDGASILLRWYSKQGVAAPGSAVLYTHGGGMILSTVEIYDVPVARYVSASGVPFLSVEFRNAPENPAPGLVTDSYAGLQWLVAHAAELGVDPGRIAVMGDSGGGGIAASLAIYARDQDGPEFARQILIYPMLDDRTTTVDPELAPFLVWGREDNLTGWGALLGDQAGGEGVSPYGAAARVESYAGLPPAYIEVGELDLFRDESLAYAQALVSAGVSTELHMYASAPHGYDALAPDSEISRRAIVERHRYLTTF